MGHSVSGSTRYARELVARAAANIVLETEMATHSSVLA